MALGWPGEEDGDAETLGAGVEAAGDFGVKIDGVGKAVVEAVDANGHMLLVLLPLGWKIGKQRAGAGQGFAKLGELDADPVPNVVEVAGAVADPVGGAVVVPVVAGAAVVAGADHPVFGHFGEVSLGCGDCVTHAFMDMGLIPHSAVGEFRECIGCDD